MSTCASVIPTAGSVAISSVGPGGAGRPLVAVVVVSVVDPRQRAVRAGVGVDRGELPVGVPAAAPGRRSGGASRAGAPSRYGRCSSARSSQPVHQTHSKVACRRARWAPAAGREIVGESVDERERGPREVRFDRTRTGRSHRQRRSRGAARKDSSQLAWTLVSMGLKAGALSTDDSGRPVGQGAVQTAPVSVLYLMLNLGILLALLCAVVTQLGFLYKHKGANEAAAVDIRHPLRTVKRAVLARSGSRSAWPSPPAPGSSTSPRSRFAPLSRRPGRALHRRRAARRDGRAPVRLRGRRPPVDRASRMTAARPVPARHHAARAPAATSTRATRSPA